MDEYFVRRQKRGLFFEAGEMVLYVSSLTVAIRGKIFVGRRNGGSE